MSRKSSPRDRSPSPYSQYSRSRSPSRNYKYSDSFDSEDSGQDTRHATPAAKRAGKYRGGSNYSNRDSVTTPRSNLTKYKSHSSTSTYVRPKKKAPPKTNNNVKRGGNTNRSQSLTNLANQSSRRSSEVAQRMLSAKGHTISRLRNELEELRLKCDEATRENRLLKQVQRRHERALTKFQDDEAELPQLLKKHSAELDSLHRRIRKYQEKEKDSERRLRDQHHQLLRAKDELERLQDLDEDKGLKDRDELRIMVQKLEDECAEKTKRLTDLEKYTSNMKKNHRREEHEWRVKEADMKQRLQKFEFEKEELQIRLREKEKELDVRNIYSQRVLKGSLKLSPTQPTNLRPLSVSKATSTDDFPEKQSPRQPEFSQSSPRSKKAGSDLSEKRNSLDNSVKENSFSAEKRSLKDSLEDKKDQIKEIQAEDPPKKEIPEHERILQDLDLGLKPLKSKEGSSEKKAGYGEKREASWERRKEQEADGEADHLKVLKMLDADVSKTRSNVKPTTNGKVFGDSDTDVYKPTWLFGGEGKKSVEKKEKKEQLLKELRSSKENAVESKKTDEEEDFPFFGSSKKQEAKKEPGATVNSVRDLHRYSTQSRGENKETSEELDDLLFKSKPKPSSQKPSNQDSDYQKKKELLLAKMKEIDNSEPTENLVTPADRKDNKYSDKEEDKNSDKDTRSSQSSGSRRSSKEYKFTDPVQNLHNGRPSHPELASPKSIKKPAVTNTRHSKLGTKDDDDLEDISFGDYAPSFGSKKTESKPPRKSFFTEDDSNDDFWGSPKNTTEPKDKGATKNSFGGESIFSTTIKAKPVSDAKTLPWETDTPDKNKTPAQRTNNSLFATQTFNQQKSPFASKPITTAGSDEIDDDIEEFIL